jgi:GNAT superfamily N-acetyltransferase
VTHLIRRARPDEVDTVAAMWTEAGQWLATIGSDQWQYPARTERIGASIAAGDECWLVEDAGGLVATLTLDGHADPEFWRPADDPGAALYVHRMVVRRAAAGAGLGSALLDWAGARAERAGRAWLRLDAWRTNARLRSYYERQGFALVRVVELAHRRSGALYQRPAGVRLRRGPPLLG